VKITILTLPIIVATLGFSSCSSLQYIGALNDREDAYKKSKSVKYNNKFNKNKIDFALGDSYYISNFTPPKSSISKECRPKLVFISSSEDNRKNSIVDFMHTKNNIHFGYVNTKPAIKIIAQNIKKEVFRISRVLKKSKLYLSSFHKKDIYNIIGSILIIKSKVELTVSKTSDGLIMVASYLDKNSNATKDKEVDKAVNTLFKQLKRTK
jgi:hypothetical protein